jgi:hypothetical protein
MDGGVVFRVRLQEHHGLVVFPGGHLDLRATLHRDGCLGKYHGEKKGREYMAEQDKKHEIISIYIQTLTNPFSIKARDDWYIYICFMMRSDINRSPHIANMLIQSGEINDTSANFTLRVTKV